MRIVASMLIVGAAFGAAGTLASMEVGYAAPIAVAGAMVLGCVVAGRPSAFAVGLGGASAALFVLVWPAWPALAGAGLVTTAHASRLRRARDLAGAVALAGIAMLAGATGGWITASFAAAGMLRAVVALGMATLIAGAPWLVAVDDEIAHALRDEARRASGAVRWTLLRAVVLRRRLDGAVGELSRQERRHLERAWRTLQQLAYARRGSPGAAVRTLDRRIAAHVDAFERLWRAYSARRALSDGFGLDAVDELRIDGDGLEAEAAALADVGGGHGARQGPAIRH